MAAQSLNSTQRVHMEGQLQRYIWKTGIACADMFALEDELNEWGAPCVQQLVAKGTDFLRSAASLVKDHMQVVACGVW